MNTADRSVGHIDYAIRRRFAFVTIPPNESIISTELAKVYFREVKSLFEKHTASDFDINDVMLGHSYS
jgi:5-methylcytosine-specific restriction protein B